ncbi:MAG: hypothetical protein PHR30_16110, partial [Gallionellaceae bacterium]|nr:hypothetical protein [Gallionellaceae bacterium]
MLSANASRLDVMAAGMTPRELMPANDAVEKPCSTPPNPGQPDFFNGPAIATRTSRIQDLVYPPSR